MSGLNHFKVFVTITYNADAGSAVCYLGEEQHRRAVMPSDTASLLSSASSFACPPSSVNAKQTIRRFSAKSGTTLGQFRQLIQEDVLGLSATANTSITIHVAYKDADGDVVAVTSELEWAEAVRYFTDGSTGHAPPTIPLLIDVDVVTTATGETGASENTTTVPPSQRRDRGTTTSTMATHVDPTPDEDLVEPTTEGAAVMVSDDDEDSDKDKDEAFTPKMSKPDEPIEAHADATTSPSDAIIVDQNDAGGVVAVGEAASSSPRQPSGDASSPYQSSDFFMIPVEEDEAKVLGDAAAAIFVVDAAPAHEETAQTAEEAPTAESGATAESGVIVPDVSDVAPASAASDAPVVTPSASTADETDADATSRGAPQKADPSTCDENGEEKNDSPTSVRASQITRYPDHPSFIAVTFSGGLGAYEGTYHPAPVTHYAAWPHIPTTAKAMVDLLTLLVCNTSTVLQSESPTATLPDASVELLDPHRRVNFGALVRRTVDPFGGTRDAHEAAELDRIRKSMLTPSASSAVTASTNLRCEAASSSSFASAAASPVAMGNDSILRVEIFPSLVRTATMARVKRLLSDDEETAADDGAAIPATIGDDIIVTPPTNASRAVELMLTALAAFIPAAGAARGAYPAAHSSNSPAAEAISTLHYYTACAMSRMMAKSVNGSITFSGSAAAATSTHAPSSAGINKSSTNFRRRAAAALSYYNYPAAYPIVTPTAADVVDHLRLAAAKGFWDDERILALLRDPFFSPSSSAETARLRQNADIVNSAPFREFMEQRFGKPTTALLLLLGPYKSGGTQYELAAIVAALNRHRNNINAAAAELMGF